MTENEEEIIADLLKAEVIDMNKPNITINPNHEIIKKAVFDYCGPFYDNHDELLQKIEISLYCFPNTNLSLAIYFVYIYLLTFEVDDVAVKNGGEEEIKRMIVLLKDQVCPGNSILEKLMLALFDSGKKANVSKELQEEMYNQLIQCFIASQRASKFMNDLVNVDLEEYLEMPMSDLGMNVLDIMARIDSGLVLTDELTNDQDFKKFRKYIFRYGFIACDMFSLKNVVKNNQWKCNYVYIVMKEKNLSAQESVNYIIKQLSKIEENFKRYGERLRERNDEVLNHFVNTMKSVVYGGLHNYMRAKDFGIHNKSVTKKDSKVELNDFNTTFNRILSAIIPEKTNDGLNDIYDWVKRMLLYNVPKGKCNRGMAVVQTFNLIAEQQKRVVSEEELELARVLGWCVEFFQAHFLIIDDIMDNSITRRGQTCWYRMENVGLMAANDAIIVEQEVYRILRLFFYGKPYYTQLIDVIHEAWRQTAYGQCMDMSSNPPNSGPQFQLYTQNRYNNIVKYKTSFYSLVLPIRLAMYMSSIISSDEHSMAEEILLKIGYLLQIQDDVIDCWGDPNFTGKIGTDIKEGKCCWPIITAFGLADDKQIRIIKENYGKEDIVCVHRVKYIYDELKLKELFIKEEENQYKCISKMIDDLKGKSELNPKIFRQLIDKIYKRQK